MIELSIDEEMAILRAHVSMGHTAGNNSTENTCFTPFMPECFQFMRYQTVIDMMDEIAKAALCGELDTTQKMMLELLKQNGIIQAFVTLNKIKTGELTTEE